MKQLFILNYKKFIIYFVVLMLSVYSIKSVSYIFKWEDIRVEKNSEYTVLVERKQSMDKEIAMLRIKVSGLREKTLDKEILEIQAKSILNLMKNNEIIIVY